MSEAEAVADMMTGVVVARAAEPHGGGPTRAEPVGADGHTHEAACLNCGARLSGDFCHRCGQASHVHRTLSAFAHDLLHGVFHFEGRIWRTIPMLAWRPGDLTRRYVAGERARFVSPLALFLFCVFLMFAVFGWTGGPVNITDAKTGANFDQSLETGIKEAGKEVAELERRRVAAIAAGRPAAAIDAKLRDRRDELSMLRLMKERGITEAGLVRASDDLPKELSGFEHAYRKAKANPSLLVYKLQNSAYKYSWALIPLSLPFMWLLFPFSRRFRMYDHAVFVTYSLCFMTLLMVVLSLLKAAGAHGATAVGLTIVTPLHMFRQLRGAYGLKAWSAALRTALLLVFSFLVLILFVLLLVPLGVLG